MDIVFLGNPDFAVTCLNKLAESKHRIIATVTNPPKRSGRGKIFKASPVSIAANLLKIPVLEIDDLLCDHTFQLLKGFKADVFVVVAYRILPKRIIGIPKFGSVNLHGSLLPKYRGAAPIQWALIHGDRMTGLTTFLIEPKIDSGHILLQKQLPIDENDDYGSLAKKMSILGADLIIETLDQLEAGKLKPYPQDYSEITSAPKITPKLTIVNWKLPAIKLHHLIRGLSPTPGVKTTVNNKQIKLFCSRVIQEESTTAPGTITSVGKDHFLVQTGLGQLAVYEMQMEGKRRLSVEEFLRGYHLTAGTYLGSHG